jgi:hypothetical protein
MTRRHQHKPAPVEGGFAQAIARKLESRGIVSVPGLPTDEPEWFDVAIEHQRRQQELAAVREARRQAEEAHEAPQTTASILMGEIAKAATGSGSVAIPLNGAAVLRAALNGGSGTVNGEHA